MSLSSINMDLDLALKIAGGVGLTWLGCRIASHVWAVLYPYVFGCTRDLKKLAGTNVAVITGATDGIGKSFAFELASKGFDVVLVSRTQSRLDQTQAEIKEKFGNVKVDTIAFDFSEGDIAVYEENLLKKLDNYEIGVLINNVGMTFDDSEILSNVTYSTVGSVVKVNTLAVTILSGYVLKQMSVRKKGVVLNVSSTLGEMPLALWSVYCATKKYMNWLGNSLRKEYKGTGITIQTLVPCVVATKMPKVDKTSLFIPSPSVYAKSALKTVGLANQTTGYILHQIQYEFVVRILPEFYVDSIFNSRAKARTLEQKNN